MFAVIVFSTPRLFLFVTCVVSLTLRFDRFCFFLCQDVVAEPAQPIAFGKVQRELLAGSKQARSQIKVRFAEVGSTVGDTAIQIMKETEQTMLTLDPDWGFEMALCNSLCGEKSEPRLIARVLSFFRPRIRG